MHGLEDAATYVGNSTSNERVWSFLGCLQRLENLAHISSCSLGSYYYLTTVELSSPKLYAYKSKPGPLPYAG